MKFLKVIVSNIQYIVTPQPDPPNTSLNMDEAYQRFLTAIAAAAIDAIPRVRKKTANHAGLQSAKTTTMLFLEAHTGEYTLTQLLRNQIAFTKNDMMAVIETINTQTSHTSVDWHGIH